MRSGKHYHLLLLEPSQKHCLAPLLCKILLLAERAAGDASSHWPVCSTGKYWINCCGLSSKSGAVVGDWVRLARGRAAPPRHSPHKRDHQRSCATKPRGYRLWPDPDFNVHLPNCRARGLTDRTLRRFASLPRRQGAGLLPRGHSDAGPGGCSAPGEQPTCSLAPPKQPPAHPA